MRESRIKYTRCGSMVSFFLCEVRRQDVKPGTAAQLARGDIATDSGSARTMTALRQAERSPSKSSDR